jgi:oligosaccharyltransferase complex subunit beta
MRVYCLQVQTYSRMRVMLSNSTIFDVREGGNGKFATEVSQWVFQHSGVIRIKSHHHSRVGEKDQHGIYRIKDDIVIVLL